MDPQSVLSSYGLAGLVILVEAGVIVYFTKRQDALQNRYDAMQEQRINDAKDTRDKLTEPLEKQAAMSEKIYDLLLSSRRGK